VNTFAQGKLMPSLKRLLALMLTVCLANQQVAVAYFGVWSLWLMPHKAAADVFTDSAASGQSFGTGLVNSFAPPSVDQGSGQITLQNGMAQGQGIDQSGLYPQAVPGSMDAAHNAYGNATAMTGVTANAQVSLAQPGNTQYQSAYQTLMGAHHASVDMSHDPIWNVSNATFTGSNGLIDSMVSGCDTSTTTASSTSNVHVPDYKTCHKSSTPQGCTVTRVVTVLPDTIEEVSSSGHGSFSDTQLSTDITVGSNIPGAYPNFGCASHHDEMVINITDASAINSVTMTAAGADDGLILYVDGKQAWSALANCQDFNPWVNGSLNVDLTAYFTSTGNHTIRVAVSISKDTKRPYGYVVLKFKKTPNFKDDFTDNPPGCRANVFANWGQITGGQAPSWVSSDSPNDQASTPYWQCLDADNARDIGGVTFDTANYGPRMNPLLPNPPSSPPAPICYQAAMRVPTSGTMNCWTDIGGVQHCPTVPISTQDDCTAYEQNPSCGYVGQECVKGASDPSTGQCTGWVVTYDCGTDQQVIGGSSATSSTICGGQLRCMGTECIQHAMESNPDFGRAAGAMSVVNGAQMDNSCSSGDTSGCKIFTGKNLTCKTALGGYVDCCSQPGIGITVSDYVELSYATWNLADKTGLINSLTQGQGVWAVIQNAGVDAYNSAMGSFTSGYEAVANASGEPFSVAGTLLASDIGQSVSIAVTQWAVDTFGQAAVSSLVSFTADSAGTVTAVEGLSELAGDIATGIGIVMAIYTIANLIIQIVYACTQDELTLGIDRQLKECHYVGAYCAQKILGICLEERDSYCCFQSPLGRIIQEQARLQGILGRPWGEPEHPDCGGLAVSDMQKLDWSKMDLSEWVAILTAAHKLPSSSTDAAAMYTRSATTSSPFPVANPTDVNSRITTQFQNQTIEQTRQQLQNQLQ
jgi:conjugal transfer mating pair stabilization protein TraN